MANVPAIASGSGYISAFDLSLKRRLPRPRPEAQLRLRLVPAAARQSSSANFKFARSTYIFDDGTKISSDLERNCKARG